MGYIKRLLDLEEAKRDIALSILVKAGAVVCCEYCDEYVNNQDDEALKRAYAIGNKMISEKNSDVEIFEGNRKELTDCIKSVYADVDWECHCEREMSK